MRKTLAASVYCLEVLLLLASLKTEGFLKTHLIEIPVAVRSPADWGSFCCLEDLLLLVFTAWKISVFQHWANKWPLLKLLLLGAKHLLPVFTSCLEVLLLLASFKNKRLP